MLILSPRCFLVPAAGFVFIIYPFATESLNSPCSFPEQQIFKVEQDGEDIIIPVNYLNSEGRTILPSHPELEPQYLQQYRGSKVAVARLFIMTADGEKLAEVPYRQFLESLTEGIYMLDAKFVLVDPISPETLQDVLKKGGF